LTRHAHDAQVLDTQFEKNAAIFRGRLQSQGVSVAHTMGSKLV
jgi:hypothetical protein